MRTALGTLLLFGLVGCEGARECTLLGCSDGFFLTVTPEGGAFAAGEYTFALTLDGATRTVSCSLNGAHSQCAGSEITAIERPSGVVFELALPGAKQIEVTITTPCSSTPLATGSFTPTYVATQPNGAGCEPTCRQASATMTAKSASAFTICDDAGAGG